MLPRQCDHKNFTSEVLFLTGVSKTTTQTEVRTLLTPTCLEVDFSTPGKVFARYENYIAAAIVKTTLHQKVLHGVNLSCRYELGHDANGQRIVPVRSHQTIIRSVAPRRGTKRARTSENNTAVSYSYKSISIDNMEYPFPSGLYLSRLIHLMSQLPRDDPAVRLLCDVRTIGKKYAKEISEVMAMVDAVERGIKMTYHQPSQSIDGNIRIFVLGDGIKPFCASALALHYSLLPNYSNFSFISIDPLLKPIANLFQHHPIEQFCGKSEDYTIDSSVNTTLDVVVACHSHAPLEDFWNRLIALNSMKSAAAAAKIIAVAMPCCADFSNLASETPICSFEDYEVYSAMRRVNIYSRDIL
jgi:hypothetical protein